MLSSIFSKCQKYIKSIENVLSFLDLAVMPEPSDLSLATMPNPTNFGLGSGGLARLEQIGSRCLAAMLDPTKILINFFY
jgi:hypothetical protein